MKNLDFKSILFGGLIVCCYLLFTGQTRSNNLGDIVVDSITIKDGGDIFLYNNQNEQVGFLGVDKYGSGMVLLNDKDGDPTVALINDNGGLVQTLNKGLHWAMIGSGNQGGYLTLRQGTEDVFFGSMVSDDKPWIAFFDRFGNLLWGKGLD